MNACDQSETNATKLPAHTPRYIHLPATMQIQTSAPIRRAIFLPDKDKPWLSRIGLLDREGRIWLHRIDEMTPISLSQTHFRDLSVYAPLNILLALDSTGTLQAFRPEKSSDPNHEYIPYARPSQHTLIGFCPNPPLSFAPLIAHDAENHFFTISFSQNINELEVNIEIDKSLLACPNPLTKIPLYSTPPSFITLYPQLPFLRIHAPTHSIHLELEDGLSIAAMDTPDYVTSTPFNFGGAFPEGFVLLASQQESRVLIISRDFLLQKAFSPTEPQTTVVNQKKIQ